MITLAEAGAIASPAAVVIGMLFNGFWVSRNRVATEATNGAKRDSASQGLSEDIAALRTGLDVAVAEFKASNARHAQHETDCALFRGETVATLKALVKSAEAASTTLERLAVHDERLRTVEDSIEWGTRRFEELFRGQAALSKGEPIPTSSYGEPKAPTRRPARSR